MKRKIESLSFYKDTVKKAANVTLLNNYINSMKGAIDFQADKGEYECRFTIPSWCKTKADSLQKLISESYPGFDVDVRPAENVIIFVWPEEECSNSSEE